MAGMTCQTFRECAAILRSNGHCLHGIVILAEHIEAETGIVMWCSGASVDAAGQFQNGRICQLFLAEPLLAGMIGIQEVRGQHERSAELRLH